MPALELMNLTKEFNGHKAIQNLSLTVKKGSVYGFLGPNGAGKTTTLRILLGLARASSGSARVLGEDIHESNRYLRRVGFLPDTPSFYEYMKAREFLRFAAQLYGLEGERQANRVESVLDMVGLTKEKKRIGTFSRGMKQRLGLAQALIHEPEVIFLDEPTSALDPIGRKDVLEAIEAFKDRVTVFFSTHILADVERVCSRAAIIHQGHLMVEEDIATLRRSYSQSNLELLLTEPPPREFMERLQELPWVHGVEVEGQRLTIKAGNVQSAHHEIPGLLYHHSLGLAEMKVTEPALEDIFIRVVADHGN